LGVFYCEGSLRKATSAIEAAQSFKNRVEEVTVKTLGYLLISGILLTSACSTQSKTVKTESYETTRDHTDAATGPVVRRTETTETEKSSTESGGILSGTVDIVGKTLALPFRAVGGLIDLAF